MQIADDIYPETATNGQADVNQDDEDAEESIEDAIARELASIQPKGQVGKQKMRFTNVKTNTECRAPAVQLTFSLLNVSAVIWIGCRYPCDPVVLTHELIKRLQTGGPVRSRSANLHSADYNC